jgi:hypothetical protein
MKRHGITGSLAGSYVLIYPSSVTFRFFQLRRINSKGYNEGGSRFHTTILAFFASWLNFSEEKVQRSNLRFGARSAIAQPEKDSKKSIGFSLRRLTEEGYNNPI